MSYASLDEVKAHLRYDDDASDEVLRAYLDASTALIDNYITDAVTESMLPALKAASLLLCGHLDDNRNAESTANITPSLSALPYAVEMLLKPYRTPTAV